MLEAAQYVRKSFQVDAIKVTTENIDELAKWCTGEVRLGKNPRSDAEEKYIKVRVLRPLHERQSQAFVGDWVVYAGTGFKVYTAAAFDKSFELVPVSV
jgi:hypothetical protein